MLQKLQAEEKNKRLESLNTFSSNMVTLTGSFLIYLFFLFQIDKAFPLNYEYESEHRINETLKINRQKLVGLSLRKAQSSQTFFMKPQVNDRASTSISFHLSLSIY